MNNALTQYIELFETQRAVIDAHAPAALNARRDAALAALKSLGRLPERGDEGFEKISLNDMFAPDYGINITRVPFPTDARRAFTCDVPNVSRMSSLLVNDAFVAVPGLENNLPEGVEIMSLAEAAAIYPDLFKEDVAPISNPVVALNTLFVQDGVFIRVGRGVHLEKPVQVLSIFNASAPLLAPRRIKIVVEDEAKASVLLCDHPRVNDYDYLNCRVIEAEVGHDASLELYDLEESTPRTRRASVTAVAQSQGSSLNLVSLFLNGGMTRNEYYPIYRGERCATRLGGMVIGGGAQIIDNAVFLTHDHPRCTSDQMFKYALFDSSQGAFEGNVTVAEGAVFTNAHQSNRNLLASTDARMHSQPQLIIYCDEVKAAHGSATGQLDEKALFYMRSRGIPENEARMMLINAFMNDVLEGIEHEALRERLRCLVDKRLRGCESTCESCGALHE